MSGVMNMLLGARTAIAVAVDEFFNRVTLLLPGDGTNGAQNNTFLDSSTNNFTITRNGNTTQGTFSPFSQTGWSNFFDGTDDRLSVPDNAKIELGSAAFTIECFAYNAAWDVDQNQLFEKGSFSVGKSYRGWMTATAIVLEVNVSGSATGAYTTFTASTTNNLNQWYHVAFVRSGNSIYIFKDGVQVGSTGTLSGTAFDTSQALSIGGAADGNNNIMMNGYISNFRIITGQAIATGTFTPPTATLQTSSTGWVVSGSPVSLTGTVALLICQSNRFVDNSASPLDITVGGGTPSVQAFSPFAPTAAYSAATVGGSGYFDGSGDYLSVANNAVFDLGTGDCTIEAWIYLSSLSSTQTILTVFPSSIVTVTGYQLNVNSSTGYLVLDTFISGTEQLITATSNPVVANQWTHVAYTRTSGTSRLFVNGSSCTFTGSISQAINSGGNTITIGQSLYPGFALPLTGYISNLRIVKGGSLYSANFTPSTSPFTTTVSAGTVSLLTNFTNAGIIDATAKNDLETVGNAQISTTQSKFGGSSMYFDGTGDYLLSPSSQNFAFPSDFTIEFWLYLTGVTGEGTAFYVPATGGINLFMSISSNWGIARSGVAVDNNFGTPPTQNTWHHIAVSRTGSTINAYIDGTRVFTGTNTSSYAAGSLQVGLSSFGTITGYIDDLRVTKYARYTGSTLTVPTAAFPLQ